MQWEKLLFSAVVFYALIPGVLVRLPPGGSTLTVNITHALVFALVVCYGRKLVFPGK
jgi:hypothetical protein